MKLVKNDGSSISYAVRGLIPAIKSGLTTIKNFVVKKVKGMFKWIHAKLTVAEDWILKKIDKIGKRAEAYLDSRLVDDSDDIVIGTGSINDVPLDA